MRINLLFLLFVLLIFFIGCSNPTLTSTPLPWQPTFGGEDCWKCHTLWNETKEGTNCEFDSSNPNFTNCGILPPYFGRGDSSYKCTEQICLSLGQDCKFEVSSDKGNLCLVLSPDDIIVPKIVNPSAQFTCKSGSCTTTSDDIHLTISNELKFGTSVSLLFKTVDARTNQELPTKCYVVSGFSEDDVTTTTESIVYPNLSPTHFVGERGGPTINHNLTYEAPNAAKDGAKGYKIKIACAYTYEEGQNPTFSTPPFQFEFNIEKFPDFSAPEIWGIEPDLGLLKNGENSTRITLKVVDDSSIGRCKWAWDSSEYVLMKNATEDCVKDDESIYYYCPVTIENITLEAKPYYFKCEDDQGNYDKYASGLSREFRQTQPLIISQMLCEREHGNNCTGEIHDRIINISVSTEADAEVSNVTCEFESRGRWEKFRYNDENPKRQNSYPIDVNGKVNVRCYDNIGNYNYTNISLTYSKDDIAPKIEKIYYNGGVLYVETDEFADWCKYTLNSSMPILNGTLLATDYGYVHSAAITDSDYFIIGCMDPYNNLVKDVYVNLVKK